MLQNKTAASNKRKITKAALVEADRVEALRLAAVGKTTEGESSDDVEEIPFPPPPPSAREVAALGKKAKAPRAVIGNPTAEDVAFLKATVAQKELLDEYNLLQRKRRPLK